MHKGREIVGRLTCAEPTVQGGAGRQQPITSKRTTNGRRVLTLVND